MVHLSEGRAFFYTHVLKGQTDPVVLEVGCGCGALTKELAATSLRVDAVESSSSRINIAKSNCRGLSNIDFYNLNLQDFSPPAKYDFVILNGVLEYSALFAGATEFDLPPSTMTLFAALNLSCSFLKPEDIYS